MTPEHHAALEGARQEIHDEAHEGILPEYYRAEYVLSICRALLSEHERAERLRDALDDILSRFPKSEIMEMLDDEERSGKRPWPMNPPSMADVRRWRALAAPRETP